LSGIARRDETAKRKQGSCRSRGGWAVRRKNITEKPAVGSSQPNQWSPAIRRKLPLGVAKDVRGLDRQREASEANLGNGAGVLTRRNIKTNKRAARPALKRPVKGKRGRNGVQEKDRVAPCGEGNKRDRDLGSGISESVTKKYVGGISGRFIS